VKGSFEGLLTVKKENKTHTKKKNNKTRVKQEAGSRKQEEDGEREGDLTAATSWS